MQNVTEELRTALIDRYVIESELGEGGMATVYLAHDTKHNRKVALKVLKPELAAMIGAERFLKEIEVTANLQHPNILPLHDSGEASGFLYYVMPYVEGETLRAKLEREKQFAIDDAVEMTRAIAGALDYAHRQGVIHRDIKPENILLLEGQPEVADFGIALAVSQAGGTRLTDTGLSIGTPQYMSPEQAMGDRELDARSDVYSLGAMLYEMLTGDPPYMGSTAQAIVAKVITEQAPPVTATRDTVPSNVAAAVHKALAKLPADRFSSAAQFAEALVTPGFTGLTTQAAVVDGSVAPANRTTRIAVAVAALMTVLFAGSLLTRPAPEPLEVSRQRVVLSSDDALSGQVVLSTAIAPDGSGIVFKDTVGGVEQLWLKELGQARANPLSGTEGGDGPFFSPDGRWIGFFAGGKLRKVPKGGGSAITLSDSASGPARGGAWLDDGTIVFNHRWNLMRVSESGGEADELLTGRDKAGFTRLVLMPTALPRGRGVFFTGCDATCGESDTYIFDLETGEPRQLVEESSRAWYTPSGHVIYFRRDGGVFAAPFDLESLAMTAAAIPVLSGLRTNQFGFADATLAADGTFLYVTGEDLDDTEAEVVWVDRGGSAVPVDSGWTVLVGNQVDGVALSPDGTRLAIAIKDETSDLWIKELDQGPLTRLTFDGQINTRPAWTADGRSVRFLSDRTDGMRVWAKRADGSDQARMLEGLPRDVWELVHSPSGDPALIRVGGSDGDRDLLLVRDGGGDSSTVSLLSGDFDEFGATLSPDGEWLAYVSDESGRAEVYVRPFPDAGASRWQVSKEGGREPLWSHGGREIFYISGDGAMMASQVTTDPTFKVDGEELLFPMEDDYRRQNVHRAYDVTRDDRRFLMLRVVESDNAESQSDLILVKNWFTELEQIVGGE